MYLFGNIIDLIQILYNLILEIASPGLLSAISTITVKVERRWDERGDGRSQVCNTSIVKRIHNINYYRRFPLKWLKGLNTDNSLVYVYMQV